MPAEFSTMTDVGTTKRRAMTTQRRLRIFEAHKGVCVRCELPIDAVREKWTVEHVRALGLGGEDEDANCRPSHEHCRREKDKEDAAAISRAKRQKARHIGIKRPSGKFARPIKEQKTRKEPLAPRAIYRTAQ